MLDVCYSRPSCPKTPNARSTLIEPERVDCGCCSRTPPRNEPLKHNRGQPGERYSSKCRNCLCGCFCRCCNTHRSGHGYRCYSLLCPVDGFDADIGGHVLPDGACACTNYCTSGRIY